jgi:alkyldihydroxyacetonephosphate synthase
MTKLLVDVPSLLVQAPGTMPLAEAERELLASSLTLDVRGATESRETVAEWLASGAEGARDAWLDPADHLVAGLEMILRDGRSVHVRPAPRRAVGPDLVSLVMGMGERFAKIESAWLRVHRTGIPRPSHGALAIELDPPLEPGESHLLEAIAMQLDRR